MTNGQPAPGTPASEAIAQMLDAHGSRVYSLALRFCGDAQNASDVVQETFLGAYKSWAGFRGESSPSTWLYRIASRACKRLHRTNARQSAHAVPLETDMPAAGPVPDVLSTDVTPLSEAMRNEAIAALENEIAALPDDYRIPIVLKEIAGLSVAETAAVLDMKEATVKTRLHRGRLALYHALSRTIPTRDFPPPNYDAKVCLDLLNAKQDALDRGAEFPQMDGIVCERCRAIFKSLDLSIDLCRSTVAVLPEDLREQILAQIHAAA
ncbi:MAG: RNA polymerase sigma factor [Phycisphaerales bacterium]|nr:RNA polymerase sigma factor [Phycisphaerales bacterium]